MKIGIDARFWGLENAGLGRYTEKLIRSLEEIDNKNLYHIFLREKYFNKLEFKENFTKIKAEYKHYSFSEQAQFLKILNSSTLDLVHFLHFNFPVLYKRKFVVTIHDLLMQKHRGSQSTTLPFFIHLPKLFASKYVFRNAVRRANTVIVPSFAVKKEVSNYFKIQDEKIQVTYEGVEQKFIKDNSIKQKGNYFLYVGSAYPHKNLNRTIKAFLTAKTKLVIVSARNIFTQNLEREIKKLKAEQFIELRGFLSDQELVDLYSNSQGFIYPSLSEGFGLPGLEAMATGTLLLASDIPVFREVYKNIPLYFDPYNEESIASAIHKAKNLKINESTNLIKKGKLLVSNYNWTKTAQETLDIYSKALK